MKYLSDRQMSIMITIRGTVNAKSKRLYARDIHTLTLASLLRKRAITLSGKQKRVDSTPLGELLYKETMSKDYMSWKDQIASARDVKRG